MQQGLLDLFLTKSCDTEGKKWSVNLGAVLGQMTTGGGLNRLNATLALLDVPGMYKRMFAATEALLGMEMMKQLATSMRKVATEEREHYQHEQLSSGHTSHYSCSGWWLV